MTTSPMYRALFRSAVLALSVLGCTEQVPTTPQASEPEVTLMSVSEKQPALFKNVAKYSEIGSTVAMSSVRSDDVTLTVRALLGSDGRVTLVVTTGHIDAEDAPGTIDHLQIKLLDPNGNEKRTLNYSDLEGGRAEILLPTGVRGGTIFVHANVKGIGNGTDVVKVQTTIKMLPDLAIGSINAPDEALRNTPVNISAVVMEKNGDFGARGDCVLFEDGVELSRASAIWVDAGRSVTCAFLPMFKTVGKKMLTVKVLGCNPTDWDASNNSVSTAITIVDPRALNDFVWTGRVAGRANIRGIQRSEGYWELPAYGQRSEWSYYKEYQGEGWRDANVDGRRASGLSGPLTATYKDRIDATVLNDGAFDPTRDRRTTFEMDQNIAPYGKVRLKQACSSLTRSVTVTGPRGNIPATVARLFVCSNVYTGAPGAEKLNETWFSYSAYAGDVTYYANDYSLYVSPGYKDAYSYNGNIDYTFGTIALGSEYAFEVKVTGVEGSLTSAGIIPLTAEEKTEVYPFQCTEYSGDGYSERSCSETNLKYTKFGGTAKGIADPRP